MKKHLLNLLFVLLFTNAIFGQQAQQFDENSTVGTKIEVPALAYTNDINKYYFNKKALDKIITYMKENETVYIEVNCFSDFKEVSLINLMATQDQADNIRAYMVSKGIAGSRVVTFGNGDLFPIYTEDEMSKMNAENKIAANLKNRRIGVKIIKM